MTATRGSAAPMASDAARVVRFGRTERTLHWVHATAFLAMFATGLALYLPMFAQVLSNRPLVKALHLVAAAAWFTALVLVALLGNRRALRRTRRDLERFTADDLRWLRRQPAPQGRFNAGQKAHASVQAALAVLFTVSGALLWLGERNTDFRLPGTIALHDVAMFAGGALVAGHVAMAFATRPALEGMLHGTVPARWAAEHHAAWTPAPPPAPARVGAARIALAIAVATAGLAAAVFLAGDALG
jgi:formate dehydrogenase subunit gamma